MCAAFVRDERRRFTGGDDSLAQAKTHGPGDHESETATGFLQRERESVCWRASAFPFHVMGHARMGTTTYTG